MASEKLSQLSLVTSVAASDLFYIAHDNTTNFLSRSITFQDLSTQMGSVASVGLSMPSGFSVANSPITSSGTLGVTITGQITFSQIALTTDVLSPVTETTMSGNATITAGTSKTYQFFDPNGSDRNVTLPVAATGLTYFIMNIGSANTLTVKDNGGSNLATILAGNFNTFIYSGSAWRVI